MHMEFLLFYHCQVNRMGAAVEAAEAAAVEAAGAVVEEAGVVVEVVSNNLYNNLEIHADVVLRIVDGNPPFQNYYPIN